MQDSALHTILILLAAAVITIGLFRRLRLSSILGYLVVGALLGPHAFGWLPDNELTHQLAELGVVFLMFNVGLEFSIPTLIAARRLVVGLGGAQVLSTTLLAGLAAWYLGLEPAAALVVGGAIAMSSTAMVMRQLSEQMELSIRHGRLAVSILLFQDLATLPFLVLLPRLAEGTDFIDQSLLLTLAKGVGVFLLLAFLGRKGVRPLFRWLAAQHSTELFMLAVLLIVLGAAAIAHAAGLSPPLGAFLAGMVLGETEFRHQVESDIQPFQEVLLGLFFTTVGMKLNPAILIDDLLPVLLLVFSILFGKTLLIGLLAWLFGEQPGVAGRTSLVLCQGGEFGLLFVSLGLGLGLLENHPGQILLAALVLTMVAAPFLIRYNRTLVNRLDRLRYQRRIDKIDEEAATTTAELKEHVIIVGFGRIGQNLGQLLSGADRRYVAIDLDPERIAAARAAGEPVVYGDALRGKLLQAAGIERAAALVITLKHPETALRIVQTARRLNPDVFILVRTRDDAYLDILLDTGATEVLPEGLESSLMMGAQLLRRIGVPDSRIMTQIAQVRADRYKPLRRFFHAKEVEYPEQSYRERLGVVTLPAEASTIGRSLNELDLADDQVTVMSVIRNGVHMPKPVSDKPLHEGDVLVLSGPRESLETARRQLQDEE